MSQTTLGLIVPLKAKADKGQSIADLLVRGKELADAEPETKQWFGLKFPNNNYAIFDTFTSESGRTAHLSGKIAEALTSKASTLLDKDLDISHVEIFSSVIRPSAAATVGIYVPLVVKAETAEEVKEFIITTLKPIIDAEPNTTQWYACRKSKTEFHLLLLATDEAARDEHMNGPAAGIMGGKAHLWAEPAKLQFCEVVAVKVV